MSEMWGPREIKMCLMCETYARGNRSVAACCEVVGISTAQHYLWLRESELYRIGWAKARELYIAVMEDLLDTRIREGSDTIKITCTLIQDPETGEVREIPVEKTITNKKSDALLMLYLKSKVPETFGKGASTQSGPDIAEILAGARRRLGEPEDGDEE